MAFNQVASLQSIKTNINRVIPLRISSTGVKCKIVNTIDDNSAETVGSVTGYDELEDILKFCLGDTEDERNENETSELYDKYCDSVDFFAVCIIDEPISQKVCNNLKTVLQHCYRTTYSVDMYTTVEDTQQYICVLFMKLSIKSSFNAIMS
jgi:hypothetical protein